MKIERARLYDNRVSVLDQLKILEGLAEIWRDTTGRTESRRRSRELSADVEHCHAVYLLSRGSFKNQLQYNNVVAYLSDASREWDKWKVPGWRQKVVDLIRSAREQMEIH